MKTIYTHTDPANAARVEAVAKHFAQPDDKIEKAGADAAVVLPKLKDDPAQVDGQFEAVISAGLPTAQQISAGYKKYGVVTHLVGVAALTVEPDEAAPAATVAPGADKKPSGAKAKE